MSRRSAKWAARRRWAVWAVPVIAAVLIFRGAPVWAHPLGNFTINHYAAIETKPAGLTVAYVLDMAEIPTFQEIGRLDEAGMARHMAERLGEWSHGLRVTEDGAAVPLSMRAARVACLPGAGGLPILRVEEDLSASFAGGRRPVRVVYQDANFPERVGWKEIVITGQGIEASSAPAIDRGSNRLRAYPADLLKSPPNDVAARFIVLPRRAGETSPGIASASASIGLDLSKCRAGSGVAGGSADRSGGPTYLAESTAFGALFNRLADGRLSFEVLAIALLGAFALGAYHALTPGHGKAILAAYFIGSRGTPAQAALLGTVVTLTHTTGVFLLGFATLAASRYVVPEKLYPWVSALSGVILLGVGASLFWRRLTALKRPPHLAHGHGGDHHEHNHPHHDHAHGHAHHHHLPAGETVRTRDLVTLGVTGGLLPCPSALVVMLAAISVGRVGFGLLLIGAFSLGLAAVLTAGGMLMVYSRAFVNRVVEAAGAEHGPRGWRVAAGPVLRRLPVVSAAAVAMLGLAIVIQTVWSAGLVR